MRRISVPLLVGCAFLAAPFAATAQDYKPERMDSTFEAIDPADPGVTVYDLSTDIAVKNVPLPFPVSFYYDYFPAVNISRYGYVTFSSRQGVDDVSNGPSDPTYPYNQYPLPNSAAPNGVIAAWWEQLVCPAGAVKTRDAVIQGNRTFTIEWNGCYPYSYTVGQYAAATIQMQIRFTENSPIIKMFYGTLNSGYPNWSATVGLENPPRWRQDNTGAWYLVTSGGTLGEVPALPATCIAYSGCGSNAWPTNQVIRYGLPDAPDLQAGTNPTSGKIGLQVVPIAIAGTITAEIQNNIQNGGPTDAHGATWDYYLSIDEVIDSTVDTLLPCSHSTPEKIPGLSVRAFADQCPIDAPDGIYRICTRLDPPSESTPDGLIEEANEKNNDYCSATFALGIDITGSLDFPTTGVSVGAIKVPVVIENRGTVPAGEFAAQLWLRDCAANDTDQGVLAWETAISLQGAGPDGTWAREVDVTVRPDVRGESICAVLIVDPLNAVIELDETNNTYSTCVDHGVGSPAVCVELDRPDLQIGRLDVSFSNGCFFGGPLEISAQICNLEEAEARAFGLAFFLDTDATPSLFDTRIVALPQECNSSSECRDLGGGIPVCIAGICQAPCVSDGDCGSEGLRCEQSFLIEGKSCQLVVPGETCRDVSVRTDLPTFDTWEQAPFREGDITFSAIVDWTDMVVEKVGKDENNMLATRFATYCGTQKPDFVPLEVRAPARLSSGEVTPVSWRVRNLGPISSSYAYRYVLSFNDTISTNDIPLEIVDVGRERTSFIDAFADESGSEMVRLPDGIEPGTYFLGIVLDPDGEVAELLEDNNVARTGPLTVTDSPFAVATDGLRAATVGVTYAVQLLASGGTGAYTWSITHGKLPQGLQLETSGLLGGTPLEQGTYLFAATVKSGPNTASASFALDVAPARGPLSITLAELPPAFQGSTYSVLLTASGGLPPYVWGCTSLPSWLALFQDEDELGKDYYLQGTSSAVADPVAFACSVADANGARTSRSYDLVVYPAGTIRIRSTEIPGGEAGVEMADACLMAEGGSGTYHWSVDTASLPEGVDFANGNNSGCFTGTPTACGTFLVGVTVTDERGLTDTRQLALTVYCNDIILTTRRLPVAERGVTYPGTQLAVRSERPVVFEITSGELPRGLTLSAGGEISGMVAIDARTGVHDLLVGFHDDRGGNGVGAIAIQVLPDPAPPGTVTRTTSSGCSTSGDGWIAGLLPLAVVLALLGLRRRSPVGQVAGITLIAALAATTPAIASAQTQNYFYTFQEINFQRLVGGSVAPLVAPPYSVPCPYPVDNCLAPIDLPFTFTFFDEEYTRVIVDTNGLLHFTSDFSSGNNVAIPSSSAPNAFIAPWWDDLETHAPGDLTYLVRGTAPNREFVVEWRTRPPLPDTDQHLAEMQVSLFENNTIAMRWGTPGAIGGTRASVGIEDAGASARSISAVSCSPNCVVTDWETDLAFREVIFFTKPNLRILETNAAPEGRTGFEQEFRVTAKNTSPAPASAAIELFLSEDPEISPGDLLIGRTPILDFGSNETVQASITLLLPLTLGSGTYHLLARVDPDNLVEEYVETDNDGGAFRFVVLDPIPDLAFGGIRAPASGAPGSNVTIDITVHNLNNLDAVDVPVWTVLSSNDVITASDIPLFRGTVSVSRFQTVEKSVVAALPADLRPGVYWLGAILDPELRVSEIDKTNNTAASTRPFLVTVHGLVVTTLAPQSVQVGSEFCIPLQAEGGDGVYTWMLVEGALPPGLEIVAGTSGASICGRPTRVGIHDFTLEVTSADRSVRTEMTLVVTDSTLEFSVGVRELPIARLQVPYEAGLLAFGGTAPYTWELTSGALPAGLSLERDGLVFGTPLEAGTFSLEVRVTDAADRTANETVRLPVAPPPRLTCTARTLGTLALGESFAGKLYVAGGDGRYEWTTLDTVRYGDSGLDIVPTDPPPGLELKTTTGIVTGTPTQVGQFIWTLRVASGTETDTCAVAVDVVGGQGIAITTVALPNAVPEREYRTQLKAQGGAGTLRWTLSLGSDLPKGLSLDPTTGVIFGTPAADALGQDEETRSYGFQVEVRDARNVKGTSALSVTLAREAEGTAELIEREEGGCQTAGGGVGLAALALVLGALRRRR